MADKFFVTNVQQAIALSRWKPTVHEVEVEWPNGEGSDWFLIKTVSLKEKKQLVKMSGEAEIETDGDTNRSIKIDLASMDNVSNADWLRVCLCSDMDGSPFFKSEDEVEQFIELNAVLGEKLALEARKLNRRKKAKDAKNA